MARRALPPEDRAAWDRVAKTVTPLRKRIPKPKADPPPTAPETAAPPSPRKPKGRIPAPLPIPAPALPTPPTTPPHDAPIDTSWDKRLRNGDVQPDFTIDLHGLTLAHAHAAVDRLLGQALTRQARLLLVITGKPRHGHKRALPGEQQRGSIRAEIRDWLKHSAYATDILAVRNAARRHGGDGALYVVLRRRR